MKIAWIGTGIMGKAMLKHLEQEGYFLQIFNRTIIKAKALENDSIVVCNSVSEVIDGVDVIFTMLGYPDDVEEIYLGAKGIFENIKNHQICVDMTTSSPKLAKKIADKFLEKNVFVLDAPVSGGEIGAINKTLTIMVGGDFNIFNKIKPLFKILGKSVQYMGESGNGQHTKMANQISIAASLAGTCETIYYCLEKGLDLNKALDVIVNGSASSWQLINNGKNIVDKNFAPGFYVKHFLKDMKIAQQEMFPKKLDILDNVIRMYEYLVENNYQEYGTQILIQYYLQKFF